MPSLKTIHHLFFADCAILVSDTISCLQDKLDLIKMQSERLGLGGQLVKLSFFNCKTSFIMKAKKSCIELQKSLDTINCCTLDIFLKLKGPPHALLW